MCARSVPPICIPIMHALTVLKSQIQLADCIPAGCSKAGLPQQQRRRPTANTKALHTQTATHSEHELCTGARTDNPTDPASDSSPTSPQPLQHQCMHSQSDRPPYLQHPPEDLASAGTGHMPVQWRHEMSLPWQHTCKACYKMSQETTAL